KVLPVVWRSTSPLLVKEPLPVTEHDELVAAAPNCIVPWLTRVPWTSCCNWELLAFPAMTVVFGPSVRVWLDVTPKPVLAVRVLAVPVSRKFTAVLGEAPTVVVWSKTNLPPPPSVYVTPGPLGKAVVPVSVRPAPVVRSSTLGEPS